MPSYCCVPNCTNNVLNSGIDIYAFPRNEALKYIWATKIGIEVNRKIPKAEGVCSAHFVQSDYLIPRNRHWSKKLKQGAVPSVFRIPATPKITNFLSKEPDGKKKLSHKLISRLEGIPMFEKYVEKIKQNHIIVTEEQEPVPVIYKEKNDVPPNECSLEHSLWPDGFMELDQHKRASVPRKRKPQKKPSRKLVIILEDKDNRVSDSSLNDFSTESASSKNTKTLMPTNCAYKNVSKKSFSPKNTIKNLPIKRIDSKPIPKNSFSKSNAKPRKRIHSELIFETSNFFKNSVSANSSENQMNVEIPKKKSLRTLFSKSRTLLLPKPLRNQYEAKIQILQDAHSNDPCLDD